ncbi:DUF4937 domain-containing protein [Xanthovirga aplysinae]|uniref:DUF4937 domain-containing protein n=1 Tax=Xanthovirga aplysinae TaxID=2529853 RepID=UPI0012BCEB66|nr:DUF4937 domain-containing protein [Xanthovirga aplysinae]MTI32345.1 DUF4937 domain-containing protein [Xanthovirga aplysinae]
MYVKWIVCQVEEDKKESFSEAQVEWIKIGQSQGLMGQVGGWNKNRENEACIISFWKNKSALERFMQTLHDEVFERNRQADFYSNISVSYFNGKMPMVGMEKSLNEVISKAQFLRIADCKVIKDRQEQFEKVQQSIWLPAMQIANGMLGGEFSVAEEESTRYLVATFWETEVLHEDYVRNILPGLRKKAGVSNNIIDLGGKGIVLEEKWRVLPNL